MKTLIKFLLLFAVTSNLWSQSKFVLCELFTSTTCGPCASANPQFDAWLSTYADKHKVVIIKPHVWWPSPGNDPYYLSNTSENQARVAYYAANAVPIMYINGVSASSSASTWKTKIMSALTESALLSMSITGNFTSQGGEAKITLTSNGSALPTGTLVLHTVVTESGLQHTGTNGDPNHEFVMRKMIPNSSGENIDFRAGATKIFTKNITFNSAWKPNNLEVVAFLQVNETKEILQASKYKVVVTSDVKDLDLIPKSLSLKQNYPNPFNPETKIDFSIPSELANNNVTLKIFDILGNEVSTVVNQKYYSGNYSAIFNSNGIPSGIYFYQLKVGQKVLTKQMVLTR